jgi:hypothetical protein
MSKKFLNVTTSDELQRVFDVVINDLVQANCYYKLFKDINGAVDEYSREMNQSPAFWHLTRDALLDAAILRLCRVYERNKDVKVNSIRNLLVAIKRNLHMFEFEPFRERTKSNQDLNPFESWRKLDETQLDSDILSIESNPAIERLVFWRDKKFVHRDSTLIIRKIEIDKGRLPTFGDYDSLLAGGMTILNRYLTLFKQHTWGHIMVGHDDYTVVLKLIRDGLDFVAKGSKQNSNDMVLRSTKSSSLMLRPLP